ncbi:MAG TPA: GTPase Era [Anaerolineae bacterium]|jgi:GTP-binding protein Era|nr:GTPase Era [Anaerolineae bacterium]
MQEEDYRPSEMAELDLSSLSEEELPKGHKSGLVAVAGRPNVGKSTLLNQILKQKIAIVTPRPQTTRTNQLGILTRPEYQIIFVDTPGLMKPRHKLDEFMVGSAEDSVRDADIVLWLVDVAGSPGAGDRAIAATLGRLPEDVKVIMAMNKSDLLAPEDVLARTETYGALLPAADWLLISALNDLGLDALLEMIIEALPEGPRYYPADQTTDSFVRDLAAEFVREQIYLQMREEIPYGAAVQVTEFKERENGVIYIRADIYVERDAHKKMIIGAKGAQLRKIGAAARTEIEQLVGERVFLELWVRVERNWRKNEQTLKRLGYQ